ncbi:peptide chain release factor 2 [Salibacterium qingdaonense]|uniref:peptide chain release factor 2 n=1 Tax=Salibacterium qingdaonense TaxID=266892 RepID=UPI00116037B3|nr:peptide chain release factor 2 [Salibacterium qingdaonense]
MDMAEIQHALSNIRQRLADFRGSLDLSEKEERIAELEQKMTEPGFWDNPDESKQVIDESNVLKNSVEGYRRLSEAYDDLVLTYDLVKEEDDEDLKEELEEGVQTLTKNVNDFELNMMLSEPYDQNNAILELHPGAGGTESQDWAQMLYRMYKRWAEGKGYTVDVLDYLDGDEAGLKSAVLHIKGHNAYGYLKAEKGVHRLVRISPFDSSGRRHTSFASCEVMPEMDDTVEVEINSEDLRIDTYRSSGAGGQHVNTTDSAVRITHLPTNIIVTCQNERSQLKNRDSAMKMLRSKLYQRELEEQQKEMDEIRGEQKEIGWGSQIRSYVFHPYNMVKDHRTNQEMGNTSAVMDGNIDPFIDGYLRASMDI